MIASLLFKSSSLRRCVVCSILELFPSAAETFFQADFIPKNSASPHPLNARNNVKIEP